MRPSKINIKYVTRLEFNGVTYHWHVEMRGSDYGRDYVSTETDENNVAKEYAVDWLPKCVREFVKRRTETQFEIDDNYIMYTYM